MNQDGRLTLSYRKTRSIGPLHTEGPVIVTSDAKRIITCLGEQAILTNVETGEEICRFLSDTAMITAMALAPSEKELVVVTASLSIHIYPMPSLYSPPTSKAIEPLRHIPKAHDAPVHVVAVDPTSSYVATGSADGVAKVWDLKRGFVTHAFKGHGGVISCLRFHIAESDQDTSGTPNIWLVTGSVDTRVRIFDLVKSNLRSTNAKPFAVLDGHVSVPRAIDFSADGKWMLTAGRDSVVLVWQLHPNSEKPPSKKKTGDGHSPSLPTLAKTIPVSEAVEALAVIEPVTSLLSKSGGEPLHFIIAGEKGIIRIWDAHKGKLLRNLQERQEFLSTDAQELQHIQEAIYCPTAASVVTVHADQNIVFHSLNSLSTTRHLIGFNDEIVDSAFLSTDTNGSNPQDTYLALATNSALIRVYATSKSEGLNSYLLSGHGDTVLALDCSADGRILISGSKDNTVRVWAPVKDQPGQWACVAVGEGHAESIGALSISKKTGVSMPGFLVTGSQDRTVKVWDLTGVPSSSEATSASPQKLSSFATQKVHEKDVNSLDISPNDRLLATGSQDKTAKIFEIQHQQGTRASLKLVGTLKGHKRGVWNVKFSKTERLIATASGDKSVKLWTLEDYTCIKTFEGHTNSVLRVAFISNGQQLLTTASDGLLKLWNVRGEECVATMDNHEEKVWALAVSHDERTVVTAAADSVVTFWTDSTETEQRERDEKREAIVAKEQDLANYVALQDYKNAIFLALSMEHPRRLYNLFSAVSSSRTTESLIDSTTGEILETYEQSSITGNPAVDEVIQTLPAQELSKLLRLVRDWNATARTSAVAQLVLHAIVKLRPADDIKAAFNSQKPYPSSTNNDEVDGDIATSLKQGDSLKDILDALIPYTERHLTRMDRLLQDSYILDFLLSEMDGGIGVMDEDDEQ
ncbi:hypothetical protein M408DRAFT_237363 [Serendipita vermifera MAFF 305830]|uniref:U3 small nucleolar RNA-associated protein 13 C-terminal domain-containing protein n=1 Tax=Serendipita vermifera MAFF 305830 TaxID=933852 RepID=A0A0C3BHZ1_SERVB|nr:hypothetical protein M408DRAFT_237363 [Serendipita vermifera MAFF 305830]